ncbi:MAG: redox-regulated ATPase YchF [Chloroflexi bacterium]|nr:redox-regulated ATPase YchF [Chloroflexota bacterium]
MKLGLVGLPMSGKTTIFNALTGQNRPTTMGMPGKLDVQMAVVEVPDPRLDALTAMYEPKKKVPARITYADIGGLTKGISEGGLSGPFRTELSQMDGFLIVLRHFQNDAVPHPEETIDPQRDLTILDSEFLFTDLLTVENRITRLNEEMSKGKNREANAKELALFERLQAVLEEEKPLRDMELSEDEQRRLRGYAFLTMKPRLIVLNTGEAAVEAAEVLDLGEGDRAIAIRGELEAEIAQLDEDDAAMFMQEYDIEQPVRDRVIRESYRMLSVQTFFTVGEDECRAWPHPVGSTAQKAAGTIHSDLEKGFIRAEIIEWDTLVELGSMAEAKSAGKLRLEGRDYLVQDGEVMHVRHSG